MKTPTIKPIAQDTFILLALVYTIIILAISLNFISKYSLYFNILALIIAIFGISTIGKETSINNQENSKLNNKLHLALIILAILLILIPRITPYINNTIPIGYDAGIYKYSIEQFKTQGFGVADWVKATMSPLFLYLTYILLYLFSSSTILTWIFILSCLLLGFAIYLATKAYFNKETALIALLIYSVSLIQFKVFALMYYKNILALSLMLFSIYFLKKNKRIWFIIFASLTGAMHLSTFYIFGLAYFIYVFTSPINNNNKTYNLWLLRNNIINGILILILTLILYFGFISQAILPLILPVLNSYTNPGEAPGTFLSFFQYQFSTLAYLPFAILGFLALAKRRQFNMIFFITLLTAIIVYFQFFFFNRFIIHLDIMLIILSGLGFSVLIEHKKKLGVMVLVIMLASSFYLTMNESKHISPLISQSQMELIIKMQDTEQNASVISISSQYAPYILAYSGRKTIAPGLFDENKWNLAQWTEFWGTNSTDQTKELMQVYEKPIYLFASSKEFNNPCFILYLEQGDSKVYKYNC